MNRIPIWAFFISIFFILHSTKSDDVNTALLQFLGNLTNSNAVPDPSWGWNSSSDPCQDNWKGVTCTSKTPQIEKLTLDGMNFDGTFDPKILCSVSSIAESLSVISLNDNSLHGQNLDEISRCKYLTRLHIRKNQFSGSLPDSISSLNNLNTLEIAQNQFSGVLPDLVRISGLREFYAENNDFSGPIANFDFANFLKFNVSSNNFTGPIPQGGSRFPASSYEGNKYLCGDPLPNKCPAVPQKETSKGGLSTDQILMYSGYFLIFLVAALLIMFKFCGKGNKKDEKVINTRGKESDVGDTSAKYSYVSSEYRSISSKSGISAASVESAAMASTSLVVLTSPEVNGLKFEDLLRAPAELVGRGKHGSVYKVVCEGQGLTLAVKRIKDWTLSSDEFKLRMKRLDQVRHPSVLPAVAFYCSRHEKLIVYEYQPCGSLFKLLHGDEVNQVLDWSSRLNVAATIANALSFMHDELQEDAIAHGNLKSSNILLNQNMEPLICEYGIMGDQNQEHSVVSSIANGLTNTEEMSDQRVFKSDIYEFGVILLEMLTGKVAAVQNNGMDLAKWVVSVVREEWTGEVFDRSLIREGASEERMVNLLQIAIKCVNRSPEARPSINQVALIINTIKEEDEKSIDVSQVLSL